MSKADMRKSRRRIQTLPYRVIYIDVLVKSLTVAQPMTNVLRVYSYDVPLPKIDISLTALPLSTQSSFYPNVVQLSGDIQSTYVSFMAKSTGTVAINVTLSGPRKDDFRYVFTSKSSISVLKQVVTSVPKFISAKFRNEGTSITLTFDSPTDRGGMSSQLFDCSVLFTFKYDYLTVCQWDSDSTVILFPGSTVKDPGRKFLL